MRAPIKFNRSGWPNAIGRFFPAGNDPRSLLELSEGEGGDPAAFSRAVTALKFGDVFKTSSHGRHGVADRWIAEHAATLPAPGTFLDIGASDGSTALDLIGALDGRFARYFVTDAHLHVDVARSRDSVCFLDPATGGLFLVATPRFLVYCEVRGAVAPIRWLAKSLLDYHRRRRVTATRVLLVQPRLRQLAERDPRVVICPHDVFVPWPGPRPDVVKVANLFNLAYFSATRLAEAARTIGAGLGEGAHLVVVENRANEERAAAFRREPDRWNPLRVAAASPECTPLIASVTLPAVGGARRLLERTWDPS